MKKPLPKEVFDNPEKYINFLTLSSDNDFECQYFDRKEAGRLDTNGNICSKDVKNLKENFVTCISAFANSNKQGGLLVVGIDSNGKIIGINHLSEEQINCLCNYNDQLVNQAIQNKPCYLGNKKEIILIYVPYSDSICETISKNPRSWQRLGKQNIEMTQEQKEILKRDKQIVSYEKNFCCKFDPEDLDKDMIEEFKKNYLIESDYYENYTVKDILNQIGAIKKNPNNNDTYYFTNAGFLFFASNPRREIPYSYIRLLRFKSDLSQDKSSISTLDKDFSGPIVKQIQKIRIYLNESGFFDIYQKRSPDGGFIEEPEFPVIAIDEAIVNSVAHRDYAIQKPIECYKFNDTFIVINPGRILQNEQDIPFSFSLDKINLNHNPRNSYIIDWLRKMKDSEGRGFIRALSEGTRRMVDEMKKLNLPAPKYDITPAQTKVSLYNNYVNRIKDIQEDSNQKATEYTNLYPLEFYKGNNLLSVNEIEYSNTELLKELSNKLNLNKWYIDKLSKNILVAFRTEDKYKFNKNIDTIIGFYPAFSFSLKKIWQNHCLCIDYNLKIKNRLNISILLNIISSSEFIDKSAIVHWGEWIKGKIKSINENNSIVLLYDNDEEVEVPNNKIIPNLPILMIERILKLKKVNFDLYTIRKKFSLSLDTNASFKRADMTQNIVNYISSHNIFPISLNEIIVDLIKTPVTLNRQNIRNGQLMVKNLKEPKVEFNSGNQTEDIREGITKFGSRDVEPKDIEIVPFCMENYRDKMSNLINNIKNGQYKYRGSERNFFTKIFYNSIISINSTKNILTKCQYIIKNNPNWINNPQLNRLFLVHTPDNEYALDDEHSDRKSVV